MQVKLENFEEILLEGNMDALTEFLKVLDENDKEKYASKAVATLKKASKGSVQDKEGRYGWHWDLGEATLKTSLNATLCLANDKQLKSIDWGSPTAMNYADWILMEDLNPKGLKNFAETLINANVIYFPVVRKLLKTGLSHKPTCEAYYTGVIGGTWRCLDKEEKQISLKEILLREEDILEDIWESFKVEGDQENSFASVDKYTHEANRWETTLVELAGEGHISRMKLLDATLDSLALGFIQFRSNWFSRLHESLKPTVEERIEFIPKYGLLVGSSIPSTVSFAIKALKKACSKTSLSAEFLLENISPAMTVQSKSTINAAMSIVEKTMKADSSFKQQGCILLADALSHESVEVQKKCLSLITKYGDSKNPELVQRLLKDREIIAKSVVPDLENWLPEKAIETASKNAVSTVRTSEEYEENPAASDGWPFKQFKLIKPINKLEELLEQAAYCLEHTSEVIEFERVLDAISRTSVNYNEDFEKETSALKKRALKFYTAPEYSIPGMQRLRSAFIYDWLTRSDKPLEKDAKFKQLDAVHELVRDRMLGILARTFSGVNLPVISSPTHEGGWINSKILFDRYKSYVEAGQSPDETDLCLAMFRCPNDSILKQLPETHLEGKFIDALRYRTKLSDRKPKGRKLAIAAEYLKEPVDPRKKLDLGSGPLITRDDHYESAHWLYHAIPAIRESYFRINIGHAAGCIKWMEVSDFRIAASLERLMDSGAPLGESSHELMAIGLIVENPECIGYAREAVIAAVHEGRLNLKIFAKHISRFLHSDLSKPKRLSESLFEISRVSPRHLNAMRRTTELALSGEHPIMPRGLSYLFETFEELLAAEGVKLNNPETVDYLQKVATGGKTAKIIGRILEV